MDNVDKIRTTSKRARGIRRLLSPDVLGIHAAPGSPPRIGTTQTNKQTRDTRKGTRARRFVLHNTNYFDKIGRMLQRIRNGAGGVHIRPVVCPYPQQSKRRPKPQHIRGRPIWTTWTTEHRHTAPARTYPRPKRRFLRPKAPFMQQEAKASTPPALIWTTWTTEHRHARRCVSVFAPWCV